MYSPVFLSWPTISGSPPVLSISLSDHSFSVCASSFACTLAHSRPLWRFMFFSKLVFNTLSSSSRCFDDNCFLFVFVIMCYFTCLIIYVYRYFYQTFTLQLNFIAEIYLNRKKNLSKYAKTTICYDFGEHSASSFCSASFLFRECICRTIQSL